MKLCTHDHPEREGGTVSAIANYEMRFTAAIGCSDLAAAEQAAADMNYYCKDASASMREIIERFRQPRVETTAA